jgi:hypothetical protein
MQAMRSFGTKRTQEKESSLMASLALSVPNEIESDSLTLVEKAQSILVVDQRTHDDAAELHIAIRELRKKVDEHYDPLIKQAFATHRAAIAAKDTVDKPLEQAQRIIKPKVIAFEQDQERIRRELERTAQEEARRREEEARLALAVQAEEMQAAPEVVEEILSRPMPTIAPTVAPIYQKTKGFTSRENWSAEVTDIKALCRAVADRTASENLVMGNGPALNQMARAMKQSFNVPGCRVVKEVV